MKAKVDQDTCIGCGICPSICPDVFSMGSDGKAHAIEDEVPSSCEDDAKDAESSCPVNAIEVD
jgi:ferredoxin